MEPDLCNVFYLERDANLGSVFTEFRRYDGPALISPVLPLQRRVGLDRAGRGSNISRRTLEERSPQNTKPEGNGTLPPATQMPSASGCSHSTPGRQNRGQEENADEDCLTFLKDQVVGLHRQLARVHVEQLKQRRKARKDTARLTRRFNNAFDRLRDDNAAILKMIESFGARATTEQSPPPPETPNSLSEISRPLPGFRIARLDSVDELSMDLPLVASSSSPRQTCQTKRTSAINKLPLTITIDGSSPTSTLVASPRSISAESDKEQTEGDQGPLARTKVFKQAARKSGRATRPTSKVAERQGWKRRLDDSRIEGPPTKRTRRDEEPRVELGSAMNSVNASSRNPADQKIPVKRILDRKGKHKGKVYYYIESPDGSKCWQLECNLELGDGKLMRNFMDRHEGMDEGITVVAWDPLELQYFVQISNEGCSRMNRRRIWLAEHELSPRAIAYGRTTEIRMKKRKLARQNSRVKDKQR